ncbi:YkgJ family cysteine cluster protein [Tautonia sociabilis]|uniref:YkgJ family cysteine cluster protein n=1 Tax=Tautonia sociabilis TaxID=2080755 RepID=A0A432MCS9_9BACT|nr:YkgJ family cysteine cluster protein [Tautonia sociabilis]RUL81417.1 YkgJ family cysteine cluster protein [Tautonia sociabilis]
MNADESAPWYRDGLRFSCTRCGNCCTGAPGYVWVDVGEVERLAAHLGLSPDEFGRRFVRQVGRRYSLVERPNGDCVFWDRASGCTVYQARPTQCRTWPFWEENLETPQDWEQVRQTCPGSGSGRWYSVEEIEAAAARTTT